MSAESGKVATGITGLDEILGGGLEEKKVYLVAGESGSGKTVFGLQFIYEGLLKGENAVYVAVNEKPEDILEDARALGWDLDKYVDTKRLILLDMVRYVDLNAVRSVRQMAIDLEKHIRENDARRLVIDSVDYMALRAGDSEKDMVSFVRGLVLALEENLGCTTILTAPFKAGSSGSGIVDMAERSVSGVCVLVHDEENARRILSVRKMRKSGVMQQKFGYQIQVAKGIVVDKIPLGKQMRAAVVGEKIRDFSVNVLWEGKTGSVSSADFRGKWLVIVFYPGDFTFVCPTELVELADNYAKFTDLGAEILSISMDSVLSHQTWAAFSKEIQKINYPMGSDPEGTVTQLFGVYTPDGTTRRSTFIVNPEGVLVAQEVHDDRIGRSTSEILRKLAAAKHVEENEHTMCPASWVPGKPDIHVDTA
jgi:peroxiredoxin (alkyl hydroperoxide reductase subunit C)